MNEKSASELFDFVVELLNQQISGHQFSVQIFTDNESHLLVLRHETDIARYQKALSLLASLTGEVGKLSIPPDTSGLTITKISSVHSDVNQFSIIISSPKLPNVFWKGDNIESSDVDEALRSHPGCKGFLKTSTSIKVITSNTGRQVMIFEGFSGLLTAQDFMTKCINLDSVDAVSLVDISTAPSKHHQNFADKFMVLLTKLTS